MYFMHADSVWRAHPSLHALAVVVDGVSAVDPEGMRARSDALRPGLERRLASAAESEMPEVAAWREAFSRMGLKPTQYRCAAEALLRRYRKERGLPSFHPLVDYLNVVSMSFATPIAAFDCARIAEGIVVRPADGTERYETFQGEDERPEPGEVVFADRDNHAHSRRWTYRQSARSVVAAGSDQVLVVVEALHAAAPRDLEALEAELRAALPAARARITGSTRLEATRPRVEF